MSWGHSSNPPSSHSSDNADSHPSHPAGRPGEHPAEIPGHTDGELKVQIRWLIRRDMAEVLSIERSSFDQPWTEEDCTAPLNVYGRSKRDGERAVLATSAPSLVIRTSWLYAAHGANFLLTMLRLGAERDALNIVGDQFGAPTSVGLLGDVTVEILRQSNGDFHELLSQRGRLLHVTASGVTSWHGFAEAIFADARERGIALAVKNVTSIPSQDYPLPAQRPLNSRLALDRLKERFGITPPSWRDALNKVMEELSRSA
mgnify:CR=1 FL=1